MDISQAPELVEKIGYPIMLDSYESQPLVFPQLCKVESIPADEIYGTKGQVLQGLGRPKEKPDGAEVQADDFASGYTWRLKMRRFARRLDLPYRMIEASDGARRIGDLVGTTSEQWGKMFALEKDDFIADMLQKGTLTAAQLQWFDNSYPNEADPTPGFIYDGLPFFDTAHTIAGVPGTTFANHVAVSALSTANLQTALTAMRVTNARDERNERVRITPNVIVTPAGAMSWTARTILNSALLPGSANNDVNNVQGELKHIAWDALDDGASASSWWLAQAGEGILVRDSGAPQIEIVKDGIKQIVSVVAYSDFGAGVTNWRYWYAANKAAA